jgi:hypothetical protein
MSETTKKAAVRRKPKKPASSWLTATEIDRRVGELDTYIAALKEQLREAEEHREDLAAILTQMSQREAHRRTKPPESKPAPAAAKAS